MSGDIDPSMQAIYDLLPAEDRPAFHFGVDTVRLGLDNTTLFQREHDATSGSVVDEVTARYADLTRTVSPEYVELTIGKRPIVLLGMFAEVCAQREAAEVEALTEHALSVSYGGSE